MDKVVARNKLGTVVQYVEWIKKRSQADIDSEIVWPFYFDIGTAKSMDSKSVDIAVSV